MLNAQVFKKQKCHFRFYTFCVTYVEGFETLSLLQNTNLSFPPSGFSFNIVFQERIQNT